MASQVHCQGSAPRARCAFESFCVPCSELAVSCFLPHKLQLPVQGTAAWSSPWPGCRLVHGAGADAAPAVTCRPHGHGLLRPEVAVRGVSTQGASAPVHTLASVWGCPVSVAALHRSPPSHLACPVSHHACSVSLQPYPCGILVLFLVSMPLGFHVFPSELKHSVYWHCLYITR